MRSVKVTFANGDTIHTDINGSKKEIEAYYAIGKQFSLSSIQDNMQAVAELEFLPLKGQGQMDIYKHEGGDCSNGGISSRHNEVLIWPDFDEHAPDNAVVIIEDMCMGEPRKRAAPANQEGRWDMFGGCFIHTSNGVVPHSGAAIKLHDRYEA